MGVVGGLLGWISFVTGFKGQSKSLLGGFPPPPPADREALGGDKDGALHPTYKSG